MAQSMVIKSKDAFAEASKLVAWNRRVLLLLGLWPDSRSTLLCAIWALYFLYHVAMSYTTLYMVLGKFILFTKVMVEILTYSHIGLRFLFLCKYNRIFGTLFGEMRLDFDRRNYASEEEAKAFLRYNQVAKNVIKLMLTFPTLTSVLYFFKPLLIRYRAIRAARLAHKNITIPYRTPYAFYKLYKINDLRTFALTYASQIPFAVMAALVQSATDCLVLTLGCHLCGRLAALAERTRRMNISGDKKEFREVVLIHQQLLRIGEMIEESLSGMMFCHLFIASTLICIVIFQILINLAPGRRMNLINIFVLLSVNILRLYSHCWVGEYLIHESDAVNSAFYECEWYDMPARDRKLIILSLVRSQYPIRFVAGGFGTFSISAFTEVMKTAMAYLSFLRNFI